jgi:hypothetical protein
VQVIDDIPPIVVADGFLKPRHGSAAIGDLPEDGAVGLGLNLLAGQIAGRRLQIGAVGAVALAGGAVTAEALLRVGNMSGRNGSGVWCNWILSAGGVLRRSPAVIVRGAKAKQHRHAAEKRAPFADRFRPWNIHDKGNVPSEWRVIRAMRLNSAERITREDRGTTLGSDVLQMPRGERLVDQRLASSADSPLDDSSQSNNSQIIFAVHRPSEKE